MLVDAVLVATPDDMHEEPTVMCLTAGMDVLVAKPLASTVAAGEATIARLVQLESICELLAEHFPEGISPCTAELVCTLYHEITDACNVCD